MTSKESANGSKPAPYITSKLAAFVQSTQYENISDDVVQKLKELLLDHIGVASSAAKTAESSKPILDAIIAFSESSQAGHSTVYATEKKFTAPYAALLNGTFAHSFDFDDTFAAGALHPGASVVPAALAQAEACDTDAKTLLVGLAVGYEVICRIARSAKEGSYERGFHSTGTAGIYGAIAAAARIKKLSVETIEAAFGLAGSKAAGSMQFLENGAWNKRLHPGFAAHDALLCIALAEAGVVGATSPLEGKAGWFHSYSTKADLASVTDKLGAEWCFQSTALKPYPACRMTHTSIELAERLARQRLGTPVERIIVSMHPVCYNIVGVPHTNKITPKNTVDAQFSNYIQTAIAWIHGSALGWAAYDKIFDKDVQELSAKVTVKSDESIAPLAATFKVEWEDGTEVEETLVAPLGEVSNPFSWERIEEKYLGLAEPVYGDKAKDIVRVVKTLQDHQSRHLISLL